jgi:ATP-dependent helicase IRC3
VARSIQELARDRRTVAFCVTVAHAQNLRRSLAALGVRAAAVYGDMPADARAQVLADFAAGRIQVVTNVAVLTEGFDDPGVSCVAMARPTRSEGMYAQCVGRGTRLAPGKRDCLVLDFVDVSSLSLCSLPSLFGMPRRPQPGGPRGARGPRRCLPRTASITLLLWPRPRPSPSTRSRRVRRPSTRSPRPSTRT